MSVCSVSFAPSIVVGLMPPALKSAPRNPIMMSILVTRSIRRMARLPAALRSASDLWLQRAPLVASQYCGRFPQSSVAFPSWADAVPPDLRVACLRCGVDRLRAGSPQMAWADLSLAENLRVGKLQMDWLRSEDLKEEKIET